MTPRWFCVKLSKSQMKSENRLSTESSCFLNSGREVYRWIHGIEQVENELGHEKEAKEQEERSLLVAYLGSDMVGLISSKAVALLFSVQHRDIDHIYRELF
jgi:hypothetical protein